MELTRDGSVFVLHMMEGENRLNRSLVDGFSRALDLRAAEAMVRTNGIEPMVQDRTPGRRQRSFFGCVGRTR